MNAMPESRGRRAVATQSPLVALSSSLSDGRRGEREGGHSSGSQAAFTAAAAVRLHVQLDLCLGGPSVRLHVQLDLCFGGPWVRLHVQLDMCLGGPSVRLHVQLDLCFGGPWVRLNVQLDLCLGGPWVRLHVQLDLCFGGPSVRLHVQLDLCLGGPWVRLNVQLDLCFGGPSVRLHVPCPAESPSSRAVDIASLETTLLTYTAVVPHKVTPGDADVKRAASRDLTKQHPVVWSRSSSS